MGQKKLKWHTEKRKLSDLIPTENNPRQMTKKQYQDLKKSLNKFDLAEIPAINTDNQILAGHQRLKILSELEGDVEIDVRIPNRKLSKSEAEEYMIRSNKNIGGWDKDILANNFDIKNLLDFGFSEIELGIDVDDINNKDKEETIKLEKPINKIHYLISIPENSLVDIQEQIKKISQIENIEIHVSANYNIFTRNLSGILGAGR